MVKYMFEATLWQDGSVETFTVCAEGETWEEALDNVTDRFPFPGYEPLSIRSLYKVPDDVPGLDKTCADFLDSFDNPGE